jgi:hypothetical protein
MTIHHAVKPGPLIDPMIFCANCGDVEQFRPLALQDDHDRGLLSGQQMDTGAMRCRAMKPL